MFGKPPLTVYFLAVEKLDVKAASDVDTVVVFTDMLEALQNSSPRSLCAAGPRQAGGLHVVRGRSWRQSSCASIFNVNALGAPSSTEGRQQASGNFSSQGQDLQLSLQPQGARRQQHLLPL